MPDPSSRRPRDIAGQLQQAGFYRREPIQQALATYDLGSLFWEARHALELTQVQLGVKRVVLTLDATLSTATVLTLTEARELAQAILTAAE